MINMQKKIFKDLNCVLQVLKPLSDEEFVVEHHETEAVLQVIGGRSIRCDVFIITKQNKVIDLEMQNKEADMPEKRIRFHASVVDTSVSKPMQKFDELYDIVVIFICDFDPGKKEEPVYHVDRVIRETKEIFKDGMEIMLVNGTYQGDDEIGRLIHDMQCTDPDDMYNEVLRNANKYYKETKEGQRIMCEAWEEERQSGKLEGELEGKLASVISLMETMNLNLEDAMNALKLTEEEKQICIERLK